MSESSSALLIQAAETACEITLISPNGMMSPFESGDERDGMGHAAKRRIVDHVGGGQNSVVADHRAGAYQGRICIEGPNLAHGRPGEDGRIRDGDAVVRAENETVRVIGHGRCQPLPRRLQGVPKTPASKRAQSRPGTIIESPCKDWKSRPK